jgi:tripartite-type tricarboxylate transporter receptor subunit TctC
LPKNDSQDNIVWQYDNHDGGSTEGGWSMARNQSKGRLTGLVAACAILVGSIPSALSDDLEHFYKSHPLAMIIGFGVGGGYDLYGRLVSRYMSKYLPGSPAIIPKNMAGAGGVRTVNFLYSIAPKDGSVIGTFSRTLPLAPLLSGASFDSRKFTWLGSVAQDVIVCFTWHGSPIKTWRDFLSMPSSLGGDGAGAEPDIYALFMKNVFGARLKLVTGYRGTNDLFLAIERGELDGACGISWGTIVSLHPDWIKDNKINVLVQVGLRKHPDLRNVPTLTDVATNPEQEQIIKIIVTTLAVSRPFAAPPDIPVDRKAALISAFEQAAKDPDLRAEAQRINLDVDPVPAATIDKLLADAYATPKELLLKTADAISQ